MNRDLVFNSTMIMLVLLFLVSWISSGELRYDLLIIPTLYGLLFVISYISEKLNKKTKRDLNGKKN